MMARQPTTTHGFTEQQGTRSDQLKSRPPSTVQTVTMGHGEIRGGALGYAATIGGGSRRWRSRSDEPTHSRNGRGGGEALVAHHGACSNDG